MYPARAFDPDCRQCPRLCSFLEQVRDEHPGYHSRPVPPFGEPDARLLIVGLAPGKHGANATGRPFTGDFAGILLYRILFEFGFSNQATATAVDDGLELLGCRITNAVKCLPPGNKPVGFEIDNCNAFLKFELGLVPAGGVILALGQIAHRAIVKGFGMTQKMAAFGHGAEHVLPRDRRLLDSYHCSRYNTQTRRLTEAMFRDVIARARELLRT